MVVSIYKCNSRPIDNILLSLQSQYAWSTVWKKQSISMCTVLCLLVIGEVGLLVGSLPSILHRIKNETHVQFLVF